MAPPGQECRDNR